MNAQCLPLSPSSTWLDIMDEDDVDVFCGSLKFDGRKIEEDRRCRGCLKCAIEDVQINRGLGMGENTKEMLKFDEMKCRSGEVKS